MKSGHHTVHPPLHSVTTLLSEVREIRNRVAALKQSIERLPDHFESTASQEEIDTTFFKVSTYHRRIDRDVARLAIVKRQLKRQGYHWE